MSHFGEHSCDGTFTSFSGVLLKSSKGSYGRENTHNFIGKTESLLLTPDLQTVNSLFQYDNVKSPNFVHEESNDFPPKTVHECSNELNCNSLNSSYFEHECLSSQVCTSFLSQNQEPNSSTSKSKDEFILASKNNSCSQFNLLSNRQSKSSKNNYEDLGLSQSLDGNQKSPKESMKKCSEDSFPFSDLLKSPSYFIPSNDVSDTIQSDSSLFGFDITKGHSLICNLNKDKIVNKHSEKFALKDSDGSVFLKVYHSLHTNNTDIPVSNLVTDTEYSCGEEDLELLVLELDEKLSITQGRKRKFADCTETQEINVTLQDHEIRLSCEDKNFNDPLSKCKFSIPTLNWDKGYNESDVTSVEANNDVPVDILSLNEKQNFHEKQKKLVSCSSKNIKTGTTEVHIEITEIDLKTSGQLLIEAVDSYRCRCCLQVYSDKHLLSKHYTEKHQSQNQTFVIKVNTSQPREGQKSIESAVFVPSPKCIVLKNVALFVCNHCQMEFVDENLYTQHIKHIHEEYCKEPAEGGERTALKRSCQKANLHSRHSFPNKKIKDSDEEDDLWKEEDEKAFKRPTSKRPSPFLKDFKPRNLSCGMFGCPHRFSSEVNLRKHQSCHDFQSYSKTKFTCFECEAEFAKWNACRSHLWRSHRVDVDLLRCGTCDSFRASTAHQMSVHQETHSEAKPYVCRHCGSAFRQLSQAINHEQTHDADVVKDDLSAWSRPTLCNACAKWFASYRTYWQHYQSVHVKLKKFSCPHCEYGCAQKSRMTDHLRTHSDAKPHSCELCPFSCADRNAIRRHRLKHLSVKHLKCPAENCSLRTVHTHFFRQHAKTKHRDKDLCYSCQLCPYENHQLENYIRHCSVHEKQIISDLISQAKRRKDPPLNPLQAVEGERKEREFNFGAREAPACESEPSSSSDWSLPEEQAGGGVDKPPNALHEFKPNKTKDFETFLV